MTDSAKADHNECVKRAAIIATITGALLFTITFPVFAGPVKEVLGDQTEASEIVVPPVAAGAGMILPDSPFYFVDKAFQNLKLSLALSPEKKAEARNLIIGERLAELRVMTERGNTSAVQSTLADITVQSEKMAKELADAASQGRNVSDIAQSINNTLRGHRDVLRRASSNANGPLALQLDSVNQSLLAAKVSVEEHLPEQQMMEAMQEDLEDEVDTQVLGVETATNKLEKRLTQLDSLVSRAENAGVNPEAIQDLKEKRAQLQQQIKTNTQNTKAAVKQLKETRKTTKNIIQNAKKTIVNPSGNPPKRPSAVPSGGSYRQTNYQNPTVRPSGSYNQANYNKSR